MNRPRPLRAVRRWWSRRRRATKIAGALVIAGLFVGGIGLGAIVYAAVRIPLPDSVALPQQNTLTYHDGSTLDTIGSVNRTEVPLAQVPIGVRNAVLAAEDRNFYHEPGISIRGIGRAVVADVTGGGIKQGGSTITQQYAKNAYLGQRRTFTRKFTEIALAIKISRKYSKDQVLEFYLNTIYFGRGAYGIEAASEAYFGQPVGALTVGQGAVLAGLIRAPSVLDPRVSPAAARARWDEVLDQLVKDKALTAAARAAVPYPSTLTRAGAGARATRTGPTSYIDAQVDTFLRRQLGDSTVDLGGLTVTTTIDKTAQAAALDAVAKGTAGAPAAVRTALVAVDPKDGAIRAYDGGAVADQADTVSYARIPPGSSFKPITLATALSNGATLNTSYSGASPQTFGTDSVRNFGNEKFGRITLREATAESVNTVYVRLAQDTGPAKVVQTAHALGVRHADALEAVPEIALGTDGVQPVDMAGVYTAFANQGRAATPYLVAQVTDRKGNVLFTARPAMTVVLTPSVAADVTSALEGVLTRGTAAGKELANGRPGAGKTGTTGNNTAAWFDGYTPQLVTVVANFAYAADNKTLTSLTPWLGCRCSQVTGGTVPASTWKLFMDEALAGAPVARFDSSPPAAALLPPPPPRVTSSSPTPTGSALPSASGTALASVVPPVASTRLPSVSATGTPGAPVVLPPGAGETVVATPAGGSLGPTPQARGDASPSLPR